MRWIERLDVGDYLALAVSFTAIIATWEILPHSNAIPMMHNEGYFLLFSFGATIGYGVLILGVKLGIFPFMLSQVGELRFRPYSRRVVVANWLISYPTTVFVFIFYVPYAGISSFPEYISGIMIVILSGIIVEFL